MVLICFCFFPFVWVLSIFSPINLPPTHYFFFPLHLPPPPPPTLSSSSSSASHQALSFPSLCSLSPHLPPTIWALTRACMRVCVCVSHTDAALQGSPRKAVSLQEPESRKGADGCRDVVRLSVCLLCIQYMHDVWSCMNVDVGRHADNWEQGHAYDS